MTPEEIKKLLQPIWEMYKMVFVDQDSQLKIRLPNTVWVPIKKIIDITDHQNSMQIWISKEEDIKLIIHKDLIDLNVVL